MLEILYYAFLVFLPTFLVTTLISLWLNPFWLSGSILKVVSILASISIILMIVVIPAYFALYMFYSNFNKADYRIALQILPIYLFLGGILLILSYFVSKATTKQTGKTPPIISTVMIIYLISIGYNTYSLMQDPKFSSKTKAATTFSGELCGGLLHRDDK